MMARRMLDVRAIYILIELNGTWGAFQGA